MKIKGQLRKVVDKGDHFISGGHGVVGARTYKRTPPEWTLSETGIRQVLLRAFPRLADDNNQRTAAARWATVINLYFRLGYTRSQIAHETGSTNGKIHGIIRSILRVSKGLRADGTGKLDGKRGRPKKNNAPE